MIPLSRPPLAVGIHRLEPSIYHADQLLPEPTLSSSLAKVLLSQSPLHAWTCHPRLNPEYESRDSKVFAFGRAAHRAILGAGDDYAVYPPEVLDKRGNATTADAKAWEAEMRATGVTPIKQDDGDRIDAMASVMHRALKDVGLTVDPDRSELTALGIVEDVACRCLVDNAPIQTFRGRKVLLDLKTIEDASPESCIAAVERYAYDIQVAHYQDTWEAATGERRGWIFAFQEKSPPYEVGFVRLHDAPGDEADWLEDARSKANYARRQWAHCLSTGEWPGYPRQVAIVGARSFYRKNWADQGANDWTETAKPSAGAKSAAYAAQAPQVTA